MELFKTNTLLVVLIGAMVLVAGLQTLQLVGLTNALTSGKVNVGSSTVRTSAPVGSSSGSSAGSLEDLPQMVGGC